MKKVCMLFIALTLCTQNTYSMQMDTHKKEKELMQCCCHYSYILLIGSIGASILQEVSNREQWRTMQVDCWDPCLAHPLTIPAPYQRVIYEDSWRERLWDTRMNAYQDELNCPNNELNNQRHFKECRQLENMQEDDQEALACITNMQTNGQNLTAAITHTKQKIHSRDTLRKECRQLAPYVVWKTMNPPDDHTYKPCDMNSPYQSIAYRGHQPYVADTRLCRFLQTSDCEGKPMQSFLESLERQPFCKKLSNQVNNDNDSDSMPSSDTINKLYDLNMRLALSRVNKAEWTEQECSLLQTLEKKNQ